MAGGALAWGRALGEFGATLVFAGSLSGVTQTAPLAIYERFSDDFTGALALSAVLVALSGAILLAVKPAGGAGCSAMLELDVGTRLGDVELDARLAVAAGECLALAGPSGAGKSSLLRAGGRPAPPRPRAGALWRARPGWTRTRGSTCRPSDGGWASCSRTTRCSRT